MRLQNLLLRMIPENIITVHDIVLYLMHLLKSIIIKTHSNIFNFTVHNFKIGKYLLILPLMGKSRCQKRSLKYDVTLVLSF